MVNYFSGMGPKRISNFKRQFNEYMFKGNNFFTFFNSKNNELLYLLEGILTEQIPFDLYKEAMNDAQKYIDEVENHKG